MWISPPLLTLKAKSIKYFTCSGGSKFETVIFSEQNIREKVERQKEKSAISKYIPAHGNIRKGAVGCTETPAIDIQSASSIEEQRPEKRYQKKGAQESGAGEPQPEDQAKT